MTSLGSDNRVMAANYRTVLTDEVRDVLTRSVITGNVLKLPPEQLDRALYEQVNKVLVTAGGKWSRKDKGHVFNSDPSTKLGLALDMGAITDDRKALQQFFTPVPLARQIVRNNVTILPGQRVLEPSAGAGAFLREVCEFDATVDAIEIDPTLVTTLRREFPNVVVTQADFLSVTPQPVYDVIVMNPPFTKGQDIKHVRHAYEFLAPGGNLYAIMPAGVASNETKLTVDFREWLDDCGQIVENLPDEAFRESGTLVRTVLVTAWK